MRRIQLRPGKIKELLYKRRSDEVRNISYEEVAQEIGYSWGTVDRYINERVQNPSLGVVTALARYFGVEPEELYIEANGESTGQPVGVGAI